MNPQQNSGAIKVGLLYTSLRALCHVSCTALFDLRVSGAENVPKKGGVLLLANHQSYLDPILIGVRLRRAVSFFAKSELFENRFFGSLIKALHAFPVRQGAGDVGAVREAINRLREGNVLTIFPEGSRTPDGTLQSIEPGSALIIRRANVPVVPVAIHGSYDAWHREWKVFRPWPIRVAFGRPMNLDHLKSNEITARVDQTLRRMLDELRSADCRSCASAPRVERSARTP